jgi:hypothetical protein
MSARRIVTPTRRLAGELPPVREARDYTVRLTLANNLTHEHRSRASSPTLALRLAVDVATREGWVVVRAEVVV